MGGDHLQFSEIAVYILKELWHAKLKHSEGKVLVYFPLDGTDEGEALDNTFLGGSKSKEVSQVLVLEVGMIQGPEGGVDVKVAANRDGEARSQRWENMIQMVVGGGELEQRGWA